MGAIHAHHGLLLPGGSSLNGWGTAVMALPSLWGWWKLDETAGAAVVASDSSGSGRHGTYTAAGTQGAGLFSGSTASQTTLGGQVTLPSYTTPTTPQFTVGVMLKTTHALGAEQQILSADGGGNRIYQFYKDVSTHRLAFTTIFPSVTTTKGATAINTGTSRLAIVVFDQTLAAASGRVKLYLDGVLDAQSTTAITISASQTNQFGIGGRSGTVSSGLWLGSVDEAFICNGPISSVDVAALWAARNS